MSKKKLNNKNSNVTKDAKVYRSTLIKFGSFGNNKAMPGFQIVFLNRKIPMDLVPIPFIKTFPINQTSYQGTLSFNNENVQRVFHFSNSNTNIFKGYASMDIGVNNDKKYCPVSISFITDVNNNFNFEYIKDDNNSNRKIIKSLPINSLLIQIEEQSEMCNIPGITNLPDITNLFNLFNYNLNDERLSIPGKICNNYMCTDPNRDPNFPIFLIPNKFLLDTYYSKVKNVIFFSKGKIDPKFIPDNPDNYE